eukprot:578997-Rhodomonas_salina.1
MLSKTSPDSGMTLLVHVRVSVAGRVTWSASRGSPLAARPCSPPALTSTGSPSASPSPPLSSSLSFSLS